MRLRSSPSEPSRPAAPQSTGAALQPPAYGVGLVDEHAAPIQAKLAAGPARPPLSAPASNSGGELPTEVRGKMERAFGTSFADVTVRPDSARAAGLGALALTQGRTIEFAPGRYRPFTREGQELLGHELTHVLQQRSGQVRGGSLGKSTDVARSAALGLHHDAGAERQADELGRKAARGEPIHDASLTRDAGAEGSAAPIQPKMGFEIEMLVLIDQDGRPVPEKTAVGNYGNHLTIDVDQGPAVSAVTPALPETSGFDAKAGFTGGYWRGRSVYSTVQEAVADGDFWAAIRGGGIIPVVKGFMAEVRKAQEDGADFNAFKAQDAFGDVAQLVMDAVTNLQQAERVRLLPLHGNDANSEGFKNAFAAERKRLNNGGNENSKRVVADEFLRLLALPVNAPIRSLIAQMNLDTYFTENSTGKLAHVPDAAEIGMGGSFYASILEVVTKAYSPETDAGLLNILAAIGDAAEFAGKIETVNPRKNRVKLNSIAGTANVDNKYHIGNARQPGQTTDASIQCTFALDLAQIASFVKSTMAPNAQSFYHTKHDADYQMAAYHYRAEEQIVLAVADATAILNEFVNPPDLPNLRGLLILMCQFLRLGKYSAETTHDGYKWHLDKNVSALLSRTNYADIRKGMPQAERAWLAGKEAQIKAKLLTKTGRTTGSCPLTDPTQAAKRDGWNITVGGFIDNVLTGDDDGVTGLYGGFKQMGAEELHPATSALAATSKLGPVFELRNMLPFLEGKERFSRDQWLPLATYLTTILRRLHERTDNDAKRDVAIKTRGPDEGQPGSYSDAALAPAWKT